MPELNQQPKQIPVEIDEQKIIVQDKTKFLQTTFKAPEPITQPVSKEWLEKQIEMIDNQAADALKKQKAYNDSLAEQKETYLKLLKEF